MRIGPSSCLMLYNGVAAKQNPKVGDTVKVITNSFYYGMTGIIRQHVPPYQDPTRFVNMREVLNTGTCASSLDRWIVEVHINTAFMRAKSKLCLTKNDFAVMV